MAVIAVMVFDHHGHGIFQILLCAGKNPGFVSRGTSLMMAHFLYSGLLCHLGNQLLPILAGSWITRLIKLPSPCEIEIYDWSMIKRVGNESEH